MKNITALISLVAISQGILAAPLGMIPCSILPFHCLWYRANESKQLPVTPSPTVFWSTGKLRSARNLSPTAFWSMGKLTSVRTLSPTVFWSTGKLKSETILSLTVFWSTGKLTSVMTLSPTVFWSTGKLRSARNLSLTVFWSTESLTKENHTNRASMIFSIVWIIFLEANIVC